MEFETHPDYSVEDFAVFLTGYSSSASPLSGQLYAKRGVLSRHYRAKIKVRPQIKAQVPCSRGIDYFSTPAKRRYSVEDFAVFLAGKAGGVG